jgi:hypothetical protein
VNDTPDEKLNELRSSLVQFHNERSNATTPTPSSSCNGTAEVNGGEEDNNDEEESSNDASSKSDKVFIQPTISYYDYLKARLFYSSENIFLLIESIPNSKD